MSAQSEYENAREAEYMTACDDTDSIDAIIEEERDALLDHSLLSLIRYADRREADALWAIVDRMAVLGASKRMYRDGGV